MKYFLLIASLLILPFTLFASQDDIFKSKGISGTVDTNTLGSYTLTYLSLESNVTTLNVGEKAELTLMGTYSDGSTKELNTDIEYIITPIDSVDVNGTVLTAKKDNNVTVQAKVGTTLSNTLNLTITWTVNGHTLPPEPDKTVNDSTLLGIDVNDNGVRDDVERYIHERFMKDPEYPKTKTALAMQDAWATQKVLENPLIESEKYYADALACESYWIDTKTSQMSGYDYVKFSLKHQVFNEEHLRDKMFNTKERVLRGFEFNKACSGNIFEGSPNTIESCQTDISIFGE